MLVLTRRQGESIVIGHDIVITIVEIKGGQTRIGISAPREVQIHRQEIFDQVRAENAAAIASARNARGSSSVRCSRATCSMVVVQRLRCKEVFA